MDARGERKGKLMYIDKVVIFTAVPRYGVEVEVWSKKAFEGLIWWRGKAGCGAAKIDDR